MNNIVLIGMMGSGKTTIGKALATQLNYGYIDTDHVIEETQGLSIAKIFEVEGESKFRMMEANVIQRIAHLSQKVIATGGGIVLYPTNTLTLKKMGKIFYLRGTVETLLSHLEGEMDQRPLLREQQMATILKVRSGLYENTANDIIDIDYKSVPEIVEEIIKRYDFN